MDPITITVRFDVEGSVTPLRFDWQGTTYPVESTGRRWQDQDGQHVLVMVPGGQVFELLFSTDEARWFLKTIPAPRSLA
jgi:hypothetical protein